MDWVPLMISVRDQQGKIVGGLTGGTYWGWLYIGRFWIEEQLRGQNCGSRLLAEAEREALRRGCHSAFLATFLVFVAGRLLGRKGEFTTTFWGVRFAHSVYILGLLAFIPALAPVVRIVISAVSFVGVWMGAAEAHDLRGWRGLVFPLVFLVVVVAGVVGLATLLAGAHFTLATL